MSIQLRAINWWEKPREEEVARPAQMTPQQPPAEKMAPTQPALSADAQRRFNELMSDSYQDRTKFDQAYNALRWDTSLTEQDRQFINSFEPDVVKSYSFKKDGQGWTNVNPLAAGSVRRQIEAQYKEDPSRFKGGAWKELGSDQVLDEMAVTLAKSGVTDLKDITQKEIGGKKVFVNKKTGLPLEHNYGGRAGSDFWSGTYEGEGNTGYTIAGYKPDGTPILASVEQSSSDLHKLAPILAIASFIPGVAPFAQALNAGIAASQGDLLGAVLSSVGAANGFGVTNIGGVPMSTINTGASVVRGGRALANGDPWGALSAGASMLPNLGFDPATARNISRAASVGRVVDSATSGGGRQPAAARPAYAASIQRTTNPQASGWSSDPLVFLQQVQDDASRNIARETPLAAW